MDIKINQLTPITDTAPVQETPQGDEGFKFTLLSKIEDSQLEEQLKILMNDIVQQGERISKKKDIKDMKRYRTLIKSFLNEVLSRSHEFSRENFLDRRGRHRVYGIIRKVDDALDALAEALVRDEKENIEILNRIGEIRGLLLDVIT